MIHSGIEANYTLPDDTYFFEAMPLTAFAVFRLFNCQPCSEWPAATGSTDTALQANHR